MRLRPRHRFAELSLSLLDELQCLRAMPTEVMVPVGELIRRLSEIPHGRTDVGMSFRIAIGSRLSLTEPDNCGANQQTNGQPCRRHHFSESRMVSPLSIWGRAVDRRRSGWGDRKW